MYTPPVFTPWLTGVLGVVSLGLLAGSSLAVVRTPVKWLWKPAVAATEWGHWLGALSLCTGLMILWLGRWAWLAAPAFLAGALFCVPLVRAALFASTLRRHFPSDPPRRSRQRVPVAISRLLHVPLPSTLPVRRAYRELEDEALGLDFYRPDAAAGRARTMVLVVHGGSWNSGDSTQLAGMNRYLAGLGYPVAALNYRLAPRFAFPAPVEDIRAAIAYLEDQHSDTGPWDRVVLVGRSSGGHLALVAAYLGVHPSIRGVVALYPPTDLVWSWHRPAPARLMDSNRVLREFIGGSLDDMTERFEEASPIRLARRDSPPTLLIHGGSDALVSPLQSRRLARELERLGATCTHLELPWGKHGMDANLAGPAGQITLYALERFLAAIEEEERQREPGAALSPAIPGPGVWK